MIELVKIWIKGLLLWKLGKISKYFFLFVMRRINLNTFFTNCELILNSYRVLLHKTIYINFRSLPFHQATKMPIFVYSNTQIISLKGYIKIESCEIHSGMIKLGIFDYFRSQGVTRFRNDGEIIFNGDGRFFAGSDIAVFSNARLKIGENFYIGENASIYVQESVEIGQNLTLAYQSQIFDTDFHYIINLRKKEVQRKSRPIYIGDYNWFGNRVTIKKGVKTPNYLIAAGPNTMLTKDYTKDIAPYSIMAGTPAKLISSGVSRIWTNEAKHTAFFDSYFHHHIEEKNYHIASDYDIDYYIK